MNKTVEAGRDSKSGSRLFCLGQIVTTPGAMNALLEAKQPPSEFLARHALGDWGEVCEEDKQANEESLSEGLRILSVYRTALAEKLWIITEADRSATTLLLPSEY